VTSTASFIACTTDPDLVRRLQASAQMAGVPNADAWVLANLPALCLHAGPAGVIVDAYAYARDVRDQHVAATPPPPGVNPAAVTDAMLAESVDALRPQD
jgi:hypothetical protein